MTSALKRYLVVLHNIRYILSADEAAMLGAARSTLPLAHRDVTPPHLLRSASQHGAPRGAQTYPQRYSGSIIVVYCFLARLFKLRLMSIRYNFLNPVNRQRIQRIHQRFRCVVFN